MNNESDAIWLRSLTKALAINPRASFYDISAVYEEELEKEENNGQDD